MTSHTLIDTLIKQSKRDMDWYYLDFVRRETRNKPHYVVCFMYDTYIERVLLIHKTHPEYMKGKYNGIGGRVEHSDKTVKDAAVREFEEEAGIRTNVNDWCHFLTLETNESMIYYFRTFYANIMAAKNLTDEQIWDVCLTRLPNLNLMRNLKWIIPLSLDPDLALPIIVRDVSNVRTREETNDTESHNA